MPKKNDMEKLLDKYGPVMKKFGNELGEAAKKGEESLVMMSKMLKIQMDIMGGTLQREKLYYNIGKEVAQKIMKGTLEPDSLEKYKKQLAKIASEEEKKKKAMSRVKSSGKSKKKKVSSKK